MSNKCSVIALLGVLVLSACATAEKMYDGPERKSSEVALFVGMNPADPLIASPGFAAQIKSVDGRTVPGSGTRVELLAGQHEMVVYCKRPGANPTNDKYTVMVEGGAQYVIGVKPGTNKCQFTNRITREQL